MDVQRQFGSKMYVIFRIGWLETVQMKLPSQSPFLIEEKSSVFVNKFIFLSFMFPGVALQKQQYRNWIVRVKATSKGNPFTVNNYFVSKYWMQDENIHLHVHNFYLFITKFSI